ncbi:DNA polymerase [Pontiellaceae bacterium B12227]|nr:DNA polymerase [Pontiellaceae bacterium B12227]
MPTSNLKPKTSNCTPILAVDFETCYGREYSLKKLDAWSYVHHPKFDCYLMSVYGETSTGPFEWVGHPKEFRQWHLFEGALLVAHNAAFDSLVFKRLQSLGIIPEIGNIIWRCTASMSVYLSAPRSLKKACKQLLGIAVDKTQRDKAMGQSITNLFGDDAMEAYALEDARLCYLLWDRYNHLWPTEEQELATLTYEWGQHGITVDSQRLEQSIQALELHRFNAVQHLPWVEDIDEDTPLSHRKLAEACREAGIPCPASLAMDDPECAAWEEKYGSDYVWVDAMRIFRRTNMLLKRFNTVRSRLFTPLALENTQRSSASISGSDSVARFPYGLKYFGAVPGRWSGDAGFNVQNMPRGELFDVDLRRCFIPFPGNVFIIADLCQIEPRILAWLIGDETFLDLVRSGVDIYEAHARSTMGYTDLRPLKEVDPAMRSLAKARTLGLGYGCGSKKFVAVAKNFGGLDISFAEAKQTVQDFRSKNLKIYSLWKRIDRDFKRSTGGDYYIELPSGRELRYLSVCKNTRGYYTASTEMGGRKRKLYGGLLTENLVQATARDVFAEQLLTIHRYLCGVPQAARLPCSVASPNNNHQSSTPNCMQPIGRVVFHVHDEVIVEVPESKAAQVREKILAIMSTTPDWLSGCPIEAEATINHHYTK